MEIKYGHRIFAALLIKGWSLFVTTESGLALRLVLTNRIW